jgi:hypothetical protein
MMVSVPSFGFSKLDEAGSDTACLCDALLTPHNLVLYLALREEIQSI